MMKRAVSVFLAIVLIAFCAGCNKKTTYDTPEEGIIGTWKYSPNEEYFEYITEAITDPNVYVELYYEFYEDGTGKTYLSTDDTVLEFTYEYDGETLTIKSSDGSFDTPALLDGDVLSVYDVSSKEYRDLKRQ